MSYLASIRRTSLVLGALTLGWGAALHAQAAGQAVQHVAMASTQGGDVARSKSSLGSTERHTVHAQRESARAKGSAQREQAPRTVAAFDNDGNRFRYDSCGCSND